MNYRFEIEVRSSGILTSLKRNRKIAEMGLILWFESGIIPPWVEKGPGDAYPDGREIFVTGKICDHRDIVVCAEDANEAIALLRQESHDLVLIGMAAGLPEERSILSAGFALRKMIHPSWL